MATAGKGVVTSTGKRGVGSGGKAVVYDASGGCDPCCGCVLPETTDTLTASIRNSAACLGCYDNNSGAGSQGVNDIDIDVDGDYTLSWIGDDIQGRRIFAVTGAAVTKGEFRVHTNADCTGANSLKSNALLGITVRFSKATGCLISMETDLDESGDSGRYSVYTVPVLDRFDGSNYALGVWHATQGLCGNQTFFGSGDVVIGDSSEMKVVID